jgi:hypothetical protein
MPFSLPILYQQHGAVGLAAIFLAMPVRPCVIELPVKARRLLVWYSAPAFARASVAPPHVTPKMLLRLGGGLVLDLLTFY